jgi:hypothetical protein
MTEGLREPKRDPMRESGYQHPRAAQGGRRDCDHNRPNHEIKHRFLPRSGAEERLTRLGCYRPEILVLALQGSVAEKIGGSLHHFRRPVRLAIVSELMDAWSERICAETMTGANQNEKSGTANRASHTAALVREASERVAVRRAGIAVAWAAGMPNYRRRPDVVGRIGRPAYVGRRLATVVVWSAAPWETVAFPPMKDAAAVGVPATDWAQPFPEVLLGRRTIVVIAAKRPAAGDHAEYECPLCDMAFHGVHPPQRYRRRRSPAS